MALPDSCNRKRHRHEDEISEFTPLSKRINNLHINSSNFPFVKQLHQPLEELKPEIQRAIINGRLTEFDCGSSRNIDAALEEEPMGWSADCYNPDLTPAENPYYYESNRLLYELYLQRSQRSHLPSTSGHF